MKKPYFRLLARFTVVAFAFSTFVLSSVPKSSTIFSQTDQASNTKFTAVQFCDLIRNPDQYENKLVLLRVSYVSTTPDWEALYDLNCADKEKAPKDKYIRPKLDCNDENSCKEIRDVISRNLELHKSGSWRCEFIMTGRLERRKLDQGNIFTGNFPLRFAIKSIEQAIRIPPEIPMPWDK
jgi:hypothetical protein